METTTRNEKTRHEMVISNPDVDVRFYLSKDEGSYVTPHWHDSLELVYVIKGCVTLTFRMESARQHTAMSSFLLIQERSILYYQKKTRLWSYRFRKNSMKSFFLPSLYTILLSICTRRIQLNRPN